MESKISVRKKYFLKRKKNYYDINKSFFDPLVKIFSKNKNVNISIYYPSSNELNILKIFENKKFKNLKYLLPIIENENSMFFCRWKKNDVLFVNKYGILEPIKSKKIIPDIVLVPLLAFDKNKNRLGYGKGFYDRYFNKYAATHKKIVTIGVAFYFQKYSNLPNNKKDFRLDYIITDKGIF